MPSDNTDQLVKVQTVLNMFVKKWQKLFLLGENIAIDEGMLKWKGRLSFRVYNPDKPTKYGIKAYILADSKTGYCWNLDFYHQQKKSIKETVKYLLTDKCIGLWHTLYMEIFYNSVKLSKNFLREKFTLLGLYAASGVSLLRSKNLKIWPSMGCL